jgi:hypothetical protein
MPSSPNILSIEGCVLGTIQSIATFPYFSNNMEIQEFRNVYNTLLDPTNARNIWTSSAFQSGEWDQSGQNLIVADGPLRDHAYAHIDFLQQTSGAIECHHPCFVTTSEGDRGLCPPMAREGDVVVVLFGGRVPYILRESKLDESRQDAIGEAKHYEFIGECYVQSYMQGLAIQQLENPEHPRSSKIFNLI